jgi:hypothetical protein
MESISNLDMTTYSLTPKKVYWDIIDGVMVALRPVEEARAYIEKLQEIEKLKRELEESDYKAIKFAEGILTEQEFAPIRTARQNARARINELESMLNIGSTQ